MKPHEVPVALFEKLAEVSAREEGQRRERYAIEAGTEADVLCLGDIWISCATYELFGLPCSQFKLWPGKPERENGLVHSLEPVFTVYGGPVGDGMWTYGKGDRYSTRVTVNYGYFSKVDLTNERQRKLLEAANGMLAMASLLSENVESETTWDVETAKER